MEPSSARLAPTHGSGRWPRAVPVPDSATPSEASIAGSIEFVMTSLERVVAKIDPDIERAIGDPAERRKIDFLIVNARDLVLRLSNEYGGAIGLGAGFSFSDGD